VAQTMTHSGSDLFSLADRRLAFLQQRQIVLAQNVANANTPGWQARDVTPFDAFLNGTSPIALNATDSRHLPGHTSNTTGTVASLGEKSPDGNSVRLDEQLSKVADVETSQNTVANIYSKFLGFYKTALGR